MFISEKKLSFPSHSSNEILNAVVPFWPCRYVTNGSFEVYRCSKGCMCFDSAKGSKAGKSLTCTGRLQRRPE